jgi:hypothetical protein
MLAKIRKQLIWKIHENSLLTLPLQSVVLPSRVNMSPVILALLLVLPGRLLSVCTCNYGVINILIT